MNQKVTSSDIARKVASSAITLWINDRETNTTIVMKGWIVVKTWVVLHPDLVIAQLDEELKCSKLDNLRSGRGEIAPRVMSVSAGR